MALETLENYKTIDGFDVGHYPADTEEDIKEDAYIFVEHSTNKITFTVQNGPIKEVGKNGCQVDSILKAVLEIIRGLNKKFPCRENSLAITKMEEALFWLKERTTRRTQEGTEGTNQGT